MPIQTHVAVLFIGTNVKHLHDAINGSFLELTNKLNNGRAWVFGANEVGKTRGQPVLVGILRRVPRAQRKLCTASKEAGQASFLLTVIASNVQNCLPIPELNVIFRVSLQLGVRPGTLARHKEFGTGKGSCFNNVSFGYLRSGSIYQKEQFWSFIPNVA